MYETDGNAEQPEQSKAGYDVRDQRFVNEYAGAIEKLTYELREVVDMFIDTVSPVLKPSEPTPEDSQVGAVPPLRSPLAETLATIRQNIRKTVATVNDARDRADV